MKEIELIGKRKAREKHFLKQNGVIEAQVFDEDIHFLKNGIYEEIDNTLIDKGDCYTNKNNAYEVKLYKNTSDNLMEVSIDDKFIKTRLLNPNLSELTENVMESKLHKNVCYPNILDNIDLEYNVLPTKVKEAIILKNKNVCVEKLVFSIETNMKLRLLENKKIIAEKDGVQIFEFDAPYMIDNEFKTNNNVFYELTKCDCDKYSLKIKIDEDWLKDENTKYPVMIDPTITNSGQNNSVYDTYIYPGDTGVDRNSEEILKVCVEKVNNIDRINRALIKFDLPTIGTGSQVISASLELWGYPVIPASYESDIVTVHQITSDWNENSADWNTMNDKFNSLVEGMIEARRGYFDFNNETIVPAYCGCDITRLVRKWYTGVPNYGLMLKLNEEKYNENVLPAFYSNNNSSGTNPKPILTISYRNQNGLLSYMNYQVQGFSNGNAYVNNYNGNLTTIFNIGKTIDSKMPVELELVYNTNDVVLNNNVGYGLGFKFNLHQTIKEKTIDDKNYLEYSDQDGTLHYFLNKKVDFDDDGYVETDTENVYYDEDGLGMNITKNNNDYVLRDKYDNIMKFSISNDVGYLTETENAIGDKTIITYNSNNLIAKIADADGSEINISYGNNITTINSQYETVILNYLNNQIISMSTLSGIIELQYNSNKLVSKIIDVDGINTSYEYYGQAPYKVKKVSLYGSEGTLGDYFEIEYGFDSTSIIDSKGNFKNIVFNSQGSVVSISRFKDKESLKNAYGISELKGTNDGTNPAYNNKLLRSQTPIGYVKNLLLNTSFEDDFNYFISGPYSTINISDEFSNTGEKSLKVVSNTYDNQIISYSANLELEKGKYYTFSCYVKSTNKLKLQLRYSDKDNNDVEVQSDAINPSNEFERHDVTIYYPEDANSGLSLRINTLEIGTLYIDDIQLEEGEVANNYNLLENSDFSKGFSDWTIQANNPYTGDNVSTSNMFEIITLNDGTKALKIKKNPAYIISMQKTFNISGKGGDVFNISFWYKNLGILSNLSPDYGSRIYIGFNYIDQENGHCDITSPQLNPNDESWQYVSNDFTAEKDYNSVTVMLYHSYDANDLYITNMSLFKDIRSVYYEYDENGNIILENNLDNKKNKFAYNKNNQLIKMTNPIGKNFEFEYDNLLSDRVLSGISNTGISNQIKYDESGNPVTTRILKNNVSESIESGLYKIRIKGTEKYLKNVLNQVKVNSEDANGDLWIIEKTDDYYKIHHSIIVNKYFTIDNNMLILSNENGDNSLFELLKNKNGSYLIKQKSQEKYLKYSESGIDLAQLEEDNYRFEFYLEVVNNVFIENNATYTEDDKFVKSIDDTLFRKKIYEFDNDSGLICSETNPKGNVIEYNYDNKKRISSIKFDSKVINYEYNDKNLVKEIGQKTRKYKFNYNEFGNISNVKIGDNINLIENSYDGYNNLTSIKYGNDNVINYTYDDFDRIKQLKKMNDNNYNYKYGVNGDLLKIESDGILIKYTYDLSKRLSKYSNNNFKIKYKYDANQNIINRNYSLDDIERTVVSTFNDDSLITKINYNNDEINYTYDELGRITSISFNNNSQIEYEYVGFGKRTSSLVKTFKINNDLYSYSYDKCYNITHIYKNSNLINKYYYDNYNELICEKDYVRKYIIKYKYDILGNILKVKTYDLDTYEFINQDKYSYTNSNWEDLLTNYNNNNIYYDEIGNPTKIGTDTYLSWINGRELKSYVNNNLNVIYNYDHTGYRTSKVVNGIKTEYYLENGNIIFEVKNSDKLYYLYDDENELVGFEFNNNTYYYLKNMQGDIIGILDDNQLIAKYCYDAWGKLISVTDENDIDVSADTNHIANKNHFRYRGYYYDAETGLYYIKNRYYNPEWRRFINADGIIGANKNILGYNLFAYCSNNPVNYYDYNGLSIFSKIKNKLKKVVKKVVKTVRKVVKKAVKTVKNAVNTVINTVKSSVSMVTNAILGGGKAQHYNNDSSLLNTLKKSDILEEEIHNNLNDFINSNTSVKTYSSSISFYNDKSIYDFDLQLAVGRADYTMTISRDIETVGICKFYKYTIEVNLYDDFGFDGYRKLTKEEFISSAMNNVGMLLQDIGIFKAYDWDTSSITFYRYEEIYN